MCPRLRRGAPWEGPDSNGQALLGGPLVCRGVAHPDTSSGTLQVLRMLPVVTHHPRCTRRVPYALAAACEARGLRPLPHSRVLPLAPIHMVVTRSPVTVLVLRRWTGGMLRELALAPNRVGSPCLLAHALGLRHWLPPVHRGLARMGPSKLAGFGAAQRDVAAAVGRPGVYRAAVVAALGSHCHSLCVAVALHFRWRDQQDRIKVTRSTRPDHCESGHSAARNITAGPFCCVAQFDACPFCRLVQSVGTGVLEGGGGPGAGVDVGVIDECAYG